MKEIKLFVATPVHSDVSIHYMQSMLKFQAECLSKSIYITIDMMKSSLVTQGRNTLVSHFLSDDCTHLLFIDSDILFYPNSIFKMIDKDVEVCSIPYPMKLINWDKVFEKNYDISSMTKLQKHTSGNKFPVKIKDNEDNVSFTNEMIELNYAPTGCLLLKREVFDKLIKAYPNKIIHQESMVDGKMTIKPNLYNFFDTHYDEKHKRYYGEDFAFSKLWRDIGGKCYALITEYITHVGEYQYTGRLIDEMIPVGIDKLDKKS
jgi:hypothetical protein